MIVISVLALALAAGGTLCWCAIRAERKQPWMTAKEWLAEHPLIESDEKEEDHRESE